MDPTSSTDLNSLSDHENELHSTINDPENEFIEDEIILCVIWKGGKLGAAVFFMETSEVHVLQDAVDIRPDFQISKQLFHEIHPTTIVTCSSCSPVFIECLKLLVAEADAQAGETAQRKPKIKLNFSPSSCFNYEQCKKRVLDMKIVNAPVELLLENKTNYLHTLINFDYKMMISALGALLYFLDKFISKIALQMPSHNILSIKTINLENLVWIDQESYNALEIFTSKLHSSSSSNKWSADLEMKEGFSIYGLFNRCSSKIGAQYMRVLLSHPSKDLNELRKRHEVIEFFMKNENDIMQKNIRDSLKNVCNVSSIITQILGTQASPSQWKTFQKTIYHALVIGEICFNHREKAVFFKELSDCLNENLYAIMNVINNLMDPAASQQHGRFIIKEGAIPELDEVRENQKKLPKIMEEIAARELLRLPDHIESCTIIYLPEIGYLLAVPAWRDNLTPEDLQLPNSNFKFLLNNIAHYKTAYCEEMDNVLGDSHLIVMKHETEIMYQIVNFISNNLSLLNNLLDKVKLLDCLISFSDIAKELDLIKPEMVSENVVKIDKGRHLLQQLCVDTFVPNDYDSSHATSLVKIFTGPNASGKSVYLKQVALIVYLAHVGSFVPAEKAIIGVMDYIHTRIQTTESISNQLSSFLLDLRQMYSCLYNSTPNTLIAIDEFGKGTADVDGLSLLSASIQHFLDRGEYCPHILVSTHFHTLLNLIPQSPLIKLQTLEFLMEDGEITYLYKVKDGSVTQSFALCAAFNMGFAKDLIYRAKQILEVMQSGGNPEPDYQNYRSLLTARRKNCFEFIFEHEKQTDEDFQEISTALENIID
ncbi:mutS protein homolog 5-like [Planococcus citri]|uniref:mutS protein homolog 5-like n=1 Tax=Planococcus citri TaxID=170843 RepID=UPI0031F7BB6F